MKKLLLSAFVIGLFIVYGLSKRENADNNQIVIPQPDKNTITPVSITNSSQTGSGNSLQITPTPSQASGSTNPPPQKGQYKNGTYTGSVADAFYGNIQVQAIISSGKISDVNFLQYPNDRNTSIMINTQAMPYLKQEAIQAQSANVDIVSGASDTSQAFQQSLQSALSQAH